MPIVPPRIPLDDTNVPLSTKNQALITQLRPLTDYRLHYVNYRYPLLSMIYAVFAGGEHTLYCDHTGPYVSAYFVDPNANASTQAAQKAKAGQLGHAVGPQGPTPPGLDHERQSQRNQPAAQQGLIVASPQQWDAILLLLKQELLQLDPPPPGVPATPMW